MVPSLGRIGLFKGKMITLCGRVTNVVVIIHGTSTKEEFEVIKLAKNNTPFPLLLGKTWIKIRSEGKQRKKLQKIKSKN
jgi:hypothetical protein